MDVYCKIHGVCYNKIIKTIILLVAFNYFVLIRDIPLRIIRECWITFPVHIDN